MKIGSLREVLVTSAKDLFLFDCRVAGLDARTLSGYRDALDAFVRFTGDIRVGEMTPELVRVYIANLSDGPCEGDEHVRAVIDHYAVIHEWIRWLYAQKFVTRPGSDFDKPPRSLTRRFCFMASQEFLTPKNHVTLSIAKGLRRGAAGFFTPFGRSE